MPVWQTPAIVLSVKPYGEADVLVTFMTPSKGRLTGMARHARKSRQRFAHFLEPLSRVKFHLSSRPGRDLYFLQQGELVHAFAALRWDLARLGAAAALAEAAGLLAGPPEACRDIFATLEAALHLLDQGLPPGSLLPAYLLRLLGLGGYRPRLHPCLHGHADPEPPLHFNVPRGGVLCRHCPAAGAGPTLPLNPGAWKLLRLAQDLPMEKLSRLRFPEQQQRQSLALLRAFLRHHLGRELKAWDFWDKVGGQRG